MAQFIYIIIIYHVINYYIFLLVKSVKYILILDNNIFFIKKPKLYSV